MTAQSTLFGPAPAAKPKTEKAKALPKVQPVAKAPASPLSAAQKGEATKAQNRLRAARDAWKIGDLRLSERTCSDCDGEQLEVLESRTDAGGMRWDAYCLNKRCERCPDHGLAEVNRAEVG